MMKYGFLGLAMALGLAHVGVASELDPVSSAPNQLIVREDAQGNREVFKANLNQPVSTDAAAVEAATAFATDANRVGSLVSGTELDRTSSQEAWCWWRSPHYSSYGYYYYSYYSYGYNYYYYPYYNYYSRGYYYYYYRY